MLAVEFEAIGAGLAQRRVKCEARALGHSEQVISAKMGMQCDGWLWLGPMVLGYMQARTKDRGRTPDTRGSWDVATQWEGARARWVEAMMRATPVNWLRSMQLIGVFPLTGSRRSPARLMQLTLMAQPVPRCDTVGPLRGFPRRFCAGPPAGIDMAPCFSSTRSP